LDGNTGMIVCLIGLMLLCVGRPKTATRLSRETNVTNMGQQTLSKPDVEHSKKLSQKQQQHHN
jgi:hypothetical protein